MRCVPAAFFRMDKTPRLLLIAPPNSYRTAAYIEAAARNHLQIVVASEGRHSLVSEIAAGLHIAIDAPSAIGELLAAHRETPFSGVVATDDATVELGSRIAARLDLPHNPPDAARLSTRKHLSREVLRNAGVAVPEFRLLQLDAPLRAQLDDFPLPVVIKPLALSASRGVIRADSVDAALDACARIARILDTEAQLDEHSGSHLLMEQFIPGQEVALEGLLHHGRLEVLALFDKPDPLDGPYFEETIYTTPSRHPEEVQLQIFGTVESACAALHLLEGPIHAELRLAADGPVVLEVAARTIGGECARLLEFGDDTMLEDLVIRHATGLPLPVRTSREARGVMMLPIEQAGVLRRIEGVGRARAVAGVEDVLVTIRDGYELVPLPEGSSYLGFIFARGDTPAGVEQALRRAHAELNVVVAPLFRLDSGTVAQP